MPWHLLAGALLQQSGEETTMSLPLGYLQFGCVACDLVCTGRDVGSLVVLDRTIGAHLGAASWSASRGASEASPPLRLSSSAEISTSSATLTRVRNSTAISESNPEFGQRGVPVDRVGGDTQTRGDLFGQHVGDRLDSLLDGHRGEFGAHGAAGVAACPWPP